MTWGWDGDQTINPMLSGGVWILREYEIHRLIHSMVDFPALVMLEISGVLNSLSTLLRSVCVCFFLTLR